MSGVVGAVRRRVAATVCGAALVLLALIAGATPGAFGGYSSAITNSRSTAATASYFTCSGALGADRGTAFFQWPLTETAGTAVSDSSGSAHPGVRVSTTATDSTTPIGCPRDAGTAWVLNGSSDFAYCGTSMTPPQTFTEEVWFKTRVAAGRLIGYGTSRTGTSANNDRQLYINASGQLVFGVYPSNTVRVIATPGAVTDGRWHHAAATLSSSGMALYLDGALVASDAATTTAETYVLGGVLSPGYWRVGYDDLSNWPKPPASGYVNGSLRYAAVYTSALTAAQIQRHFIAGS